MCVRFLGRHDWLSVHGLDWIDLAWLDFVHSRKKTIASIDFFSSCPFFLLAVIGDSTPRKSGLDHAIIHPGGLIDTPGGKEDFVLDVDDNLIRSHARTRISREDVAELCVAALTLGKGQNMSFDCITLELSDNTNNSNKNSNDKQTNGESRPKTAKDALSAFLALSKTANYAI